MSLETVSLGSHIIKYLLPTERCVFAVRRHPAMLLPQAAAVFGGLVLAFLLDTVLPADVPVIRDLLWFGWLGVVLWFSWKFADWWVERFVVTDRRMIVTSGLLTRKVAMMPLARVTDMSYQRPFLGRILGYGEFVMESAGQDQALHTITYVPKPDLLYLDVCDLLFGQPQPSGDGT
jgi:uncharacterized membrane protein YdbT with pleckstrin-like domain